MCMTKSCLRWRLESLQRLEYGCPFPLQVGGKVYILMLQKQKVDDIDRLGTIKENILLVKEDFQWYV